MTPTKIALFLGLATLALGPLAAADAAKPPKQPGNLSLSAAPNPVKYGGQVTFSGKLTGPNNSGQTVNLFSDPFPYGNFAAAGSATTNANGDYQLGLKPTVNTRYEARKGGEKSSVVTVLVRPAVSLKLSDYTPRRGQRVRFSGRVCPQHDGSSLSIQRHYSTGYRTVARTTLKDIVGSTCSSYRRTFRVRRDGRFRAVIGSHADHATGLSRSRVEHVH
jgi:hypothetical protein